MPNRTFRASALFVATFAASAHAGTVVLSLQNGNDGGQPFNTVQFQLTNISAPGINLTGFALTVGDTQFLFDQLYESIELFTGGNGTETALLTLGDRAQDGLGTDSFAYTFTNFAPAVTFRGQWDIDLDNGNFDVDSRQVLFNNGAAPNAVATFSFSDGSTINYTFPDLPSLDTYSITIPTPSTLAALALCAAPISRRRR